MGFQLKKVQLDSFDFPCGEMQVILDPSNLVGESAPNAFKFLNVYWKFEKNEEVLQLLMIVDAAIRMGLQPGILNIPYVPFSRQDRVNQEGEAFSLKVVCDLINQCEFQEIHIVDPHSDVTPALLNRCSVRQQYEVFVDYFTGKENFFLVCPDAGALKKINKLAQFVNCEGVIECSKQRDTRTGAITGTLMHYGELWGRDCYIVDDICDGGKTFVEIAKLLRWRNAGKIILMVSHGFFTKGIEVFDGLIDEIYTREGRAK